MATSRFEDVELENLSGNTSTRTDGQQQNSGSSFQFKKWIGEYCTLWDVLLILILITLIVMIALEISLMNDTKGLTLEGCCGIVSNNGYDGDDSTDSTIIPGASTLCTTKNIDSHYGYNREIGTNYCYIPNIVTNNDTICNDYLDGNLEYCLNLGNYLHDDLCSNNNINNMINKYIIEPVTFAQPVAHIITIIVSILLYFIYFLTRDNCHKLCVGTVIILQLGAAVVILVFCCNALSDNNSNIRAIGANINTRNNNIESYGSDAIKWVMDTCTVNNRPIIVDLIPMHDNIFIILRIVFAAINLFLQLIYGYNQGSVAYYKKDY